MSKVRAGQHRREKQHGKPGHVDDARQSHTAGTDAGGAATVQGAQIRPFKPRPVLLGILLAIWGAWIVLLIVLYFTTVAGAAPL